MKYSFTSRRRPTRALRAMAHDHAEPYGEREEQRDGTSAARLPIKALLVVQREVGEHEPRQHDGGDDRGDPCAHAPRDYPQRRAEQLDVEACEPNPPTSHTATMTASAAAVAFASLFVVASLSR